MPSYGEIQGGMKMIRQATTDDLHALSVLALKLWPHHTLSELETEFGAFLASGDCAVFLCFIESTPVAFAQCQLRLDYVEGTKSSPVGYLEGIYVELAYRKQGIAKDLLSRCEQWAKAQGCREFASDCELTNAQSLRFHLGVGFREANRIICFTKRL